MTQPPRQRPRWRAALPYIAGGAAIVALIIGGYWVPEIGFDGYYDSDGKYQRGKGIFDWLELLIVPLVLTGLALWVSRVDRANEQKLADERRASEQDIAADNLREATLQTFFTRMAELLLDKGLDTSPKGAKIRDVARAYTLTTLRQLDSKRKGILVQFLYDSALIGQGQQPTPIIHMKGMDLTGADLQGANLERTNLLGAHLQGANLFGAYLQEADLTGAILQGANLQRTDLTGANLQRADLTGADLTGANLTGANLTGADLIRTILEDADLENANLQGTDLERATLERATLENANLENANLFAAYLQGADLQGANLQGANLYAANLQGANLQGANLQGANLQGANLDEFIRHQIIPEKIRMDTENASPQ